MTDTTTMKAVGFSESLPIFEDRSLMDVIVSVPEVGSRDILVRVKAVSVNPVDTKVRMRGNPNPASYKILGWDAAGVVEAVGSEVELFSIGDEVYYAGDVGRQGSNAELQCVDERIVGKKPESLTFEEAAALPLTSITAWECLFERLRVNDPVPSGDRSIVIIGGAGGVGSMAIQLAKVLTDLEIVATASRPESEEWCYKLGADRVVSHVELGKLDLKNPSFVLSTTHSHLYFPEIAKFIAPFGRVALIDDPPSLDIMPFKRKSVSVNWELMFTRPVFGTSDMIEQHHLLNKVSSLVDAGKIKTTSTSSLGPINAANLKLAHSILESGRTIGKIVLTGY